MNTALRHAAHFVEQAAKRFGTRSPRLPLAEIGRLQEYSWPGNIRELQNVVERAVILARGNVVRFDDLRPALAPPAASPVAEQPRAPIVPEAEWRQRERNNIRTALEAAGGRVYGPGGAAELLGVKPTTLMSRLRALGLRRPSAKSR